MQVALLVVVSCVAPVWALVVVGEAWCLIVHRAQLDLLFWRHAPHAIPDMVDMCMVVCVVYKCLVVEWDGPILLWSTYDTYCLCARYMLANPRCFSVHHDGLVES
jgi:hypothetical protein